AMQSWWAMYDLRHFTDWTFFAFSVLIAQTIVVYLLAALVLPDFYGDAAVDLREHYYGHHRWFFALVVLLIAISIGKDLVIDGHLTDPLNLGFQGVFAAMGASAAMNRNARYHEAITVLGAIGIGAYITLLFTHLR
ncbi:MAG: hypothetical protein ACHP7D_11890, partial [Lysobacterales bacterium]